MSTLVIDQAWAERVLTKLGKTSSGGSKKTKTNDRNRVDSGTPGTRRRSRRLLWSDRGQR